MNTLTDSEIKKAISEAKKNSLPKQLYVVDLVFDHKHKLFTVCLKNGYKFVFGINEFKRLKNAQPRNLENYELIAGGVGIHWPDLDEDLSVKGFIKEHIKKTKNFIRKNEVLVS
ncbi:MAG: DUF2442 domain-containing protein [Bacteroidia bacterium]